MQNNVIDASAKLDRTYTRLLERGKRRPTLINIFDLAASLDLALSNLIQVIENEWNNTQSRSSQ